MAPSSLSSAVPDSAATTSLLHNDMANPALPLTHGSSLKNPQGAQLHTLMSWVGILPISLAERSQRGTPTSTSGAWEDIGLALPYLPLD